MNRRDFFLSTLSGLAVGAATRVIVPGRPTSTHTFRAHRLTTDFLLVTLDHPNLVDETSEATLEKYRADVDAFTVELRNALAGELHVLVSPSPLRIEHASLPNDPEGLLLFTGEDMDQKDVDTLRGLIEDALGEDARIVVANFDIFADDLTLDDLRFLREGLDERIAAIETQKKVS